MSAARIVSLLLGESAAGDGSPVTVACGAHNWKIGMCDASSVPAVCVDCDDPCSVSARCSYQDNSLEREQQGVYAMAPCVTAQCSESAAVSSALRVLSVGFAEVEAAPTITTIDTSTTKTSVVVSVALSAPGTVHCAAFEQKKGLVTAPSSLGEVVLQGRVGVTDAANNSTDITVSGLFAATSYRIYCMSVSPIGVQMTLRDVLSSYVAVETDCCNEVVVETSSALVAEGGITTSFLTVTLLARPRRRLEIRISALNAAGADVSPNPFSPPSFTVQGAESGGSIALSAALVGDRLPAGTYSIVVSFFGETAHKYEAIFARYNTVEIVAAAQALPAPVLTTAVFVADGSYVVVSFDSKTDKGGVLSEFWCSALFDFPCAETSTCRWQSASTVHAFLNKAIGCATLGSTLTLSESASIKAQCNSGGGAECDTSSWDSAVPTELLIAAPTQPIVPRVSIAAPSSIGGCDALTLDLSGATGNGGRDWTEIILSVETTATRNVSDLQRFLRDEYRAFPPTPVPWELLHQRLQL